MSKDSTPYQAQGDEALEARIVAWVLGEASPFEVDELKRLCIERPELEVFRRRIATIDHLLDESEKQTSDPAWQLDPKKRASLDTALGQSPDTPENIVAPKKRKKRKVRMWITAAASVAILIALGGLFAPSAMMNSRKLTTETATAHESRMMLLETEYPPELIEGTPVPVTPERLMSRQRTQTRSASPASRPSSDPARVIGATTASPTQIPVPASEAPMPSIAFGDTDDFGSGFGADGVTGGVPPGDIPMLGQLFAEEDASRGLSAAPPTQYQYALSMQSGESTASAETLYRSELAAATPQDAQALRELAETVEERRKTLATIVRTKGITYTGDDSFYRNSGIGARTALSTYHQLEQEKVQLESQLDGLTRYDDEQLLMYAAGLNIPDNTVKELVPKYLELKLQAEKHQSEATDAHSREAAELQGKLNDLRTQMDEEVVNLQATLRAKHDLAIDRLARVEAMRDQTRDQAAIQRGLDAQDFVEAKAAYEADLRRLEEMQARLREAPETPDPLAELTLPELVARIDALRKQIDDPVITDSRPKNLHDELQRLQQLAIKKSKATPPPPIPNTETQAAADPFSTFSLNVSDAAFILARDAIRRGERPAPGQIRVEQFYNALDYGDPAPVSGEAVATHIEQAAHPVLPGRNLVRIAARVGSTGRAATQPLHLTLLVDQSGSMVRADRRAAMENALTTLATLLGENDVVHVIGFARQPRLIAEALPGNRASEIRTLVHQSAAEGGTNMEAALELAGQIAARHQKPGAQNRVVVLSDGAVNLGDADPTRLAERITQMRQQGIATDIAGIGSDGLNDALLAELARHGDGRYHVVTPETGARLARDLAGAFRPAASDVKVQVVFNPERVGGWKLIGFEEHRLNTEDFRDDSVDAAELAAEEAGVAIYQVETLPQGRGEIGEVFIRFRDTTTGSIIERSWPLPYDPNTPALDQARPTMQLATLAMLTAEHLRGGPLGESIDLTTHRPLIQTLQPHFRHDPRAHELFEMISALSDR